MNTNDMISKIKEVVGLSEEIKLEQQTLENGAILEAESFEAGQEIFIVTEDEKVAVINTTNTSLRVRLGLCLANNTTLKHLVPLDMSSTE